MRYYIISSPEKRFVRLVSRKISQYDQAASKYVHNIYPGKGIMDLCIHDEPNQAKLDYKKNKLKQIIAYYFNFPEQRRTMNRSIFLPQVLGEILTKSIDGRILFHNNYTSTKQKLSSLSFLIHRTALIWHPTNFFFILAHQK